VDHVDDLLLHDPSDLLHTDISSDEHFQTCYDSFSQILLAATKSSFALPSPHFHSTQKVVNPTIALILCELCQINWMLAALSCFVQHAHYHFSMSLGFNSILQLSLQILQHLNLISTLTLEGSFPTYARKFTSCKA